MSELLLAVVFINVALVCYTIAVWGERLSSRLKVWHLVFFWAGVATDVVGTSFMVRIAGGGLVVNLHGITGAVALVLMVFHVGWATRVYLRRDERALASFHRRSVIVWLIWLVPFITGAVMGMGM